MKAIGSRTRSLRSAEYRGRALDAATAASACDLPRVRENHQRAAAAWTSLAVAAEERDAGMGALHPRGETSPGAPVP
jgi:hypothetical protein